MEVADFGRLGDVAIEREGLKIPYDIKILHTTPNVYRPYMEPRKYHIGRIFWETDKLPRDFAEPAKLLDEIWTGSEYNAQAIKNAGVDKPIYVIPEAIDTDINPKEYKEYNIPYQKDYKFYSMFEWTERKNPLALLEAYWREFEYTEGVSLTIKTYIDNFQTTKKQEIDRAIAKLKTKLGLSNYAPVYLYRRLMDRHQIYRFHNTFDCFVSTHRGEGWGIPQMEAMLMEKPIISTNCGGIHEYLTDGMDAMLIDYTLEKLHGNNRNTQWYTDEQKWANVDIQKVREAMRFAFEHQDKAKKMGITGGKTVRAKFSLSAVGTLMKKRLVIIDKEIQK
jgi:glycosyltransferase involved in cell wall biosynthesis